MLSILKVSTHDTGHTEEAFHELRISYQIASASPGHPGLRYLRLVQDSFKILGPVGQHLCLVYEPMREPLWLFQRRMPGGIYSLDILAYMVKFILIGLNYLHNMCIVTHTGGPNPRYSTTHCTSFRFKIRECALGP